MFLNCAFFDANEIREISLVVHILTESPSDTDTYDHMYFSQVETYGQF